MAMFRFGPILAAPNPMADPPRPGWVGRPSSGPDGAHVRFRGNYDRCSPRSGRALKARPTARCDPYRK